jgi:EAL domain-containing protein (putative c-di-GMP-specific phosphodiesterase class I)
MREQLHELRKLGYRLAVDDLGSGYSGLASLVQLHPDVVKLDMSLTRGVDVDPTRGKLIQTVAAFCGDLGWLVIAEGVETLAERDALVSLGCDLLQGYLIGKPARAIRKTYELCSSG